MEHAGNPRVVTVFNDTALLDPAAAATPQAVPLFGDVVATVQGGAGAMSLARTLLGAPPPGAVIATADPVPQDMSVSVNGIPGRGGISRDRHHSIADTIAQISASETPFPGEGIDTLENTIRKPTS